MKTISDDEYEELQRLRIVLDEKATYKDIRAHIHDGTVELNVVGGKEGGEWHTRLLLAILMEQLLGPEDEEPPNYRMVEWQIRPAVGFDEDAKWENWRLVAEVVKPEGKSSHEIRKELEEKVQRLEDQLDELTIHAMLG